MGTLLTQPGDILATYIDFQNVSIQIYGDVSPAAGKGATNVDEVVAATLIWKGRKCQ